jgi:DNA-binding MarR family transcriptional regulator
MCANLRRTSRALTHAYEEALRPAGLRATQFTILQVLSHTGEVTQGELGEMLAMDSTTLTRTLAIMAQHGWLEKRKGSDRREWRLRLANAGKVQLKRGNSEWQKVQARLRTQLGNERWHALLNLTNELTNMVTN